MRKHLKRFAAVVLAASLVIPMCYTDTGKIADAAVAASSADVMPTAETQDDGSAGLTEVTKLKANSVDGKIEVRIWHNTENRYYYSAYRNGQVTLKCAPLGLVAKSVDLSKGLQLDEESIQIVKGKEEYDWIQGSSSHVSKEYQEMSFELAKESSKIKMIFRIFNDGIGYRYEVDGDTAKTDEVTEITSEESSFLMPTCGRLISALHMSRAHIRPVKCHP